MELDNRGWTTKNAFCRIYSLWQLVRGHQKKMPHLEAWKTDDSVSINFEWRVWEPANKSVSLIFPQYPKESELLIFFFFVSKRSRSHSPMSPENLVRKIGRPGLGRHPGRLDDPLQYDDDLEPGMHHVRGGHAVERAVLVDRVHDRRRPDEEQPVLAGVVADVELPLVVRHDLALGRHAAPDHLDPDVGLDDVGLAHVADAHEERELAVTLADDGVLAEQQRLRPLLWPRELREDHADHERLNPTIKFQQAAVGIRGHY